MIVELIYEALLITGFVVMMMLVIEYINVLTRGSWQNSLADSRVMQYVVAVVLGATPGCFGAFAVVAMYSHRVVTFGALVAAMIATSGDEAFVMFTLFPEKALLLTVILMIIAFASGWLTDLIFTKRIDASLGQYCQLEIHDPEYCDGIPDDGFVKQWLQLSLVRALSCAALLVFVLSVMAGILGPVIWGWERIALLILGVLGFFVAAYAPDHFLREHVWRHIIRKHVPSVFLWTLSALLIVYFVIDYLNLEETIQANTLPVLIISGMVGIIPESGPHLVFTTLYAQGLIPFVVLLTNSIVQDGHGTLPLLAHSRTQFLLVKGINLVVGLVVGLVVYYISNLM
ncbi:MAG: putative manganese transporter [Planctomycetota bacterium]